MTKGPLVGPFVMRPDDHGIGRSGRAADATDPVTRSWIPPLTVGQRRPTSDLLRPVTVEAMTTRTALTRMATIQRVQSMPGLPSPPNAV
jgi:hypothetical protein